MEKEISRRNFIRIIGLASGCAVVAPYIPNIPAKTPVLPPIMPIEPSNYVKGWMAVSRAMLDDLPALSYVIKQRISELKTANPNWKDIQIKIGEDGNSFMKNVKIIHFTPSPPSTDAV